MTWSFFGLRIQKLIVKEQFVLNILESKKYHFIIPARISFRHVVIFNTTGGLKFGAPGEAWTI